MIAIAPQTQTTHPAELSLAELAAEINEQHIQVQETYKASLLNARRCGELLIAARGKLAHGQWLNWLKENCSELAERTAQAYMRVAEDWPKIEAAKTIKKLSLRGALKLLSSLDEEEVEIPLLEAEIIEPAKPCSFMEGDRAIVTNPTNLYSGKEVEIVGHKGNWTIGRIGGTEYPFQASELQPSTPLRVEPVPVPKPKPTAKQLVSLLERIYLEACGQLPIELIREIEAVIHG